MNDRQLNNLIRMAAEADELERSALSAPSASLVHVAHDPRAQTSLRLVGDQAQTKHRKRWFIRMTLIASAAACAGLAVRIGLPTPAPRPNPWPVVVLPMPMNIEQTELATGPSDLATPAIPSAVASVSQPPDSTAAPAITFANRDSTQGSVVLAIFEDASGIVRCVKWREHDFGAGGLADVRPGDLSAATYGQHCVVGPHTLIAVGLTGPRDELPTTDERAQAMAHCIVGGANGEKGRCETEPSSYNSASMSCLPHGLKVMVETLAMGKP